jgi:hypothetical protein
MGIKKDELPGDSVKEQQGKGKRKRRDDHAGCNPIASATEKNPPDSSFEISR